MFFFSQKNTDEQNTQSPTETLSQPITQNLTAIFGSYALWYLYAGGVLWDRNNAQKGSVKSVSSVREKLCSVREKTSTKYASNPIGVTSHTTPLAIRRGVGGEARPIGVTSHTTPLSIRRGAGGEAERGWGWGHHLFVQVKALQCDDTLLFLREKRLFGKLFYPNFRIESLAFYHKEEILKHIFLSFLSSKITT